MNLPLLDESKLEQLLDLDEGKPGLLQEMAALFKAETPRRLKAIEEGIEAGSALAVMEAAHALKGASGLMGAEIVFALARDLEIKTKTGGLPLRESRSSPPESRPGFPRHRTPRFPGASPAFAL